MASFHIRSVSEWQCKDNNQVNKQATIKIVTHDYYGYTLSMHVRKIKLVSSDPVH